LSSGTETPDGVLDFWFGAARDDAPAAEARHALWFGVDRAFDAHVRERFAPVLARADRGELRRWKLSPEGTLALILLFDQVPRNIHRGTPHAYAWDQRALALSRDGIAMGVDAALGVVERTFFYLPLEHAEDAEAQARSVVCFERLHADAPPPFRALTTRWLEFARLHRDIVARFGRFPHRNLALGRASTPDEIAWIAAHPQSFGQG
jgi:uncharacterized protein (DUF924 family)